MQQAFGYEEGVGGALGEAAHEVGIPFSSEGDVDTCVETFTDEGSLQVAANAVEHLEFEGFGVDAVFPHEFLRGGDHRFVVGGDAVVGAAGQ